MFVKRVFAALLNIDKEGGVGTYLGLPECFSGSKQKILAIVGEKFNKRLSSWFAKTLSLGGKEVLLKSIAMALPVYAMSCFRLTKHQTRKITSAMSDFWWQACEKKRKIHWVAWIDMCKPKENGGMGFRDLSLFNQSLLAKQAWKVLNEPQALLSQLYRGRYFAKTNFLECGKGFRPSYAWRSIMHGRELLQKGLMKSVANGNNTKVWLERWIMDKHPRRPCNKQRLMDINMDVAELISPEGTWREDLIHDLFPSDDAKRILQTPIGIGEDRYIWPYSNHGSYTVKSGYWFISSFSPLSPLSESPLIKQQVVLKQRVWKLPTLPKIKIFLWRVIAGALAVAERLNTRGLMLDSQCKLCGQGNESICHVLFTCEAARERLEIADVPFPINGFSNSLEENLCFLFDTMENTNVSEVVRLKIPWILWTIWKNRNAILYANSQEAPTSQIQRATEEAVVWSNVNQMAIQNRAPMSRTLMEKWQSPMQGTVKCNVNSSWRNANLHSGGAWIARGFDGNVLYHARDAFTSSPNRIVAELRCILWSLQSLRDLHIPDVICVSECIPAVEAIIKPDMWPRYRMITAKILHMRNELIVYPLKWKIENQIRWLETSRRV